MNAPDKSPLDRSCVVGVAGAGAMGAGIAQVAAAAGHHVKLHDSAAAAIDNGIKTIRANLDKRIERGRIDAGAAQQLIARIEACPALAELKDCKLVIEAVAEDLQVKRELLTRIERIVADDTVIATNTSSLSLAAMAAVLARPHNFAGAVLREAGGFPLGPFQLMDVIGNDVNLAVSESMFEAYYRDPRFQPSPLQKELVESGRLGRKSGCGWYDYRDASPSTVDNATGDYRPRKVTVHGDLGVAAPLVQLAQDAGIEVERVVRARDTGQSDLVLFDLALDYATGKRIAITVALQAGAAALPCAVGFFNAIGKHVSVIGDAPGMCIMRTVCMLANEGADAVYHGVCDAASVDQAMRYGMNYPRGPLRWADQIGLAHVQTVLRNLQYSYGMERYRCSPLIARKVAAGETFRGDDGDDGDA